MTGSTRVLVRLVLVVLALSLLVSGPLSVVGASGPQSSVHAADEPDAFSATPDEIDPDHVRMNVALAEDGSAEWRMAFWVELEDDESTAAFESISDDIDDDPDPYLTRFADRIDSTTATASDATDREMSTDNFAVETERQSLAQDYGVIIYTFDWHGFAVADGSELRAGDAIERLYLTDETRLLISWPETHSLEHASPEPDDHREHAVIWHGSQTDFVTGEPRVVASSGTGVSTVAIAAGVAVLGGIAVVVVFWYHRRTADGDGHSLPIAVSRAADDSTDDAMGEATDALAADQPDQAVQEEFLSNEERVLRLLEEHGGRMKQQDVVSELGWTDAKTSKVVSGLREEDKLESFRLGRENVLVLPGKQDELVQVGDEGE
ncbi:hypothetical protein [Natrialba sp. INN-245]|uniref:helix-turn-helix transcriptional regulator n=1 Tax=Natrialba sp. INN-245 TaxID=2690967 RepID=UPI0013106768|nr:hypothetical protein [Natrialba sp. INN-245]MWV38569.1 hypothetical protein [Natrialba sp. INN-245]